MSNYNCYKIKNTNIKLQNLLDKLFVISKILKEDNITISGSIFYAINYNINNLFNSLKEYNNYKEDVNSKYSDTEKQNNNEEYIKEITAKDNDENESNIFLIPADDILGITANYEFFELINDFIDSENYSG